jgi:hypothetical protein
MRIGVIPRNTITITSVTPASQVLCTGAATTAINLSLSSHSTMSKVYWTHSNPNIGVGVQAMNDSLVDALYLYDSIFCYGKYGDNDSL